MILYSIATEYNGILKASHAHAHDNKRYNKLNCYAASQRSASLDLIRSATRLSVASLVLVLYVWAVLMSLYSIATEYNGPLEAAHAHIHDDTYEKVHCYAASQPTLDVIRSAVRM